MKHLMIFSIGPVQDFIATARRSRDLWYGSWMLSELSKAAAKAVAQSSSLDSLVFPYLTNIRLLEPRSTFSSPNKVVAVVDNSSTVIQAVRMAVTARLQELWADAKTHLDSHPYYETIANQQIDDLLEFYWATIPFDETNANGYANAREKAEMLMAARKTTRDFMQPNWSEGSPKSSLDGARESVIPKTEYAERSDPENIRKRKIEDLYTRYRARRGEQLSGVDLLKRLGRLDATPDFKSTSDMAAFPFVRKFNMKDGEPRTLVETLKAKVPANSDGLDGIYEGLVFESRFADAFPAQELTDAQKQEFSNTLKKFAGNTKPNPYYALLAADGDFMGKVIDGHKEMHAHQNISKSLAKFATRAPDIVSAYAGVAIYSGGDDVLAYLPLNTAMACAKELEDVFREELKVYAIQEDGKSIAPTLSIGIVIVHHLEPLSDALQLVRKAEKDAKAVPGKNGLAIILSKRSGVDRPVSDKFEVLYNRLTQLITYARDGAISGGTAYEFQELHRVLFGTNIPPEAKAKEALRIVKRKRQSGTDEEIDDTVKTTFEGWLDRIELEQLAREMIVAKELAKDEEVAQ
jgi:CRISPR-associated protein Cmr2